MGSLQLPNVDPSRLGWRVIAPCPRVPSVLALPVVVTGSLFGQCRAYRSGGHPHGALFSHFPMEVAGVGFTRNRPYIVDVGEFTSRFRSDVTPFEVGAPDTVYSFAPIAGA